MVKNKPHQPRKVLDPTDYCYFCQEPIFPKEEFKRLGLFTYVRGEKLEIVCHKDCLDGDFRKGEE